MFHVLFLVISFALVPFFSLAEQTNKIPNLPANVSIYFSNTLDGRTTTVSTITAHQKATTPATDTSVLEKLPEVTRFIRTELLEIKQQAQSTLTRLWWLIPCAIVAGSYSYIVYRIVSTQRFLQQQNTWASWHGDIPLEHLLAIPQDTLPKTY